MTDRLCGLRSDDAYRACVAVLDQAGIPHEVDWGGRHPKIVFEFRGLKMSKILSHSGSPSNRSVKKSAADIRRMLREAERQRPKIAPERASVSQAEPAPAQSQDQQRTGTMDATTAAAAESNALLDVGLHPIDGEPRVVDTDLGERLGLSRPTNIRQVIEQNREEIQGFGNLHFSRANSSGQVGRPGSAFLLNEDQALLVAVLSRAPRAREVRAMLIRVFTAWRRGQLEGSISPETIETIRRVDGISRMLAHKITVIEAAVGDLVADRNLASELAQQIHQRLAALKAEAAAPPPPPQDDMVTAYEIVATMADVPRERRFSGLPGQISTLLSRFCARRGYQVRIGGLAPDEKLIFPRRAAIEWLNAGGRVEIAARTNAHVARKSGQGSLKLVPAG